jgi:hypothetical protein
MNYSYRKFEAQDFQELFKIFLKFQEKTKIETFFNLTNGQSPSFIELYLRNELKQIINKSKTYVGLCDGKIFGFACFCDSQIRSDGLDLLIVCKDPSKRFNLRMKKLLLEIFEDVKNTSAKQIILCALGPRSKFDSYKKFVAKMFNISIIRKNQLKKTIIKFND